MEAGAGIWHPTSIQPGIYTPDSYHVYLADGELGGLGGCFNAGLQKLASDPLVMLSCQVDNLWL